MNEPLFPGKSEIHQINLIFEALGSPNEELWPDYEQIRLANKLKFPYYKYNKLLEKLKDRKSVLSEKGFHLWNRLLAYDPGVRTKSERESSFIRKPTHRITAEAALEHDFFQEEPKPIHPSLFPTWPKRRLD